GPFSDLIQKTVKVRSKAPSRGLLRTGNVTRSVPAIDAMLHLVARISSADVWAEQRGGPSFLPRAGLRGGWSGLPQARKPRRAANLWLSCGLPLAMQPPRRYQARRGTGTGPSWSEELVRGPDRARAVEH